MAYRPGGYSAGEDEDSSGEGGFYFGDEEELSSYQPKFQVAVTMTSGTVQQEVRIKCPESESSRNSKSPGRSCLKSRAHNDVQLACTCNNLSEGDTTSGITNGTTSTEESSNSKTSGTSDSRSSYVSGSSNGYSETRADTRGEEDSGGPDAQNKTAVETSPILSFSKRLHLPVRKDVQEKSTGKDEFSLRNAEVNTDVRVAIARGNEAAVLEILNSGLKLDRPLNTGWPPFLHACESCRPGVLKIFLDKGADPNTAKDHLTALMVVCMNRPSQPDQNSEKCVDLLLVQGSLVNLKDRYGMTALLYACQSAQYLVARKLVASSADVNARDSRGWTPLHFAANIGHTSLARLLVESGGDPSMPNSQGETPLSLAYTNGCSNAADYLEALETSRSHGEQGSIPRQQQRISAEESSTTGGNFIDAVSALSGCTSQNSNGVLSLLGSSHASSCRAGMPSTSSRSDGTTVSGGVEVMGDLELFLMGLQLSELIPKFRLHKVEFAQLLSMTDHDLQMIGVDKVGYRKKILMAVSELHKKEWHTPKNKLPYDRLICSGELCVLLLHLSRHVNYLQGSAHFILTHLEADPTIVSPHIELKELGMLQSSLGAASVASQQLTGEIDKIKSVISKNIPNLSTRATSTPSDLSRSPLAHSVTPVSSGQQQKHEKHHRMKLSTSAKVAIGVGVIAGVGACSWAYFNKFGTPPSPSLSSLSSLRTSTSTSLDI